MEQMLKRMSFDFFGSGKHKTSMEQLMGVHNALLLDVRSKEEATAISLRMESLDNIQGLHIPVNEIPDRISEIPKDKLIAIFCPANVRATMTYMFLLSKGYENVFILEGGYVGVTEAIKPGKLLKAIKGSF